MLQFLFDYYFDYVLSLPINTIRKAARGTFVQSALHIMSHYVTLGEGGGSLV